MVKTYGYDSPRTNQGPLKMTLAKVGKNCQETVSPTDATDRPLVDRRGIDAFVYEDLENSLKELFCTVSKSNYICAARKGVRTVYSQMDCGRGLVCVGSNFLHVLTKTSLINLEVRLLVRGLGKPN